MSITVTDISKMFHNFENTRENIKTNQTFRKSNGGKAIVLASSGSHRFNLQRKVGNDNEDAMLNKYEIISQNKVVDRNTDIIDMFLIFYVNDERHKLYITGRIDGFVHEKGLIVEHKRRTRGLLGYVPYHEKVQCYLYMRMLNCKKIDLIETFGEHMNIHEISFDWREWSSIVEKIKENVSKSNLKK